MGFLIPILQTALGWLVSALLDEVKKKWDNKEIKALTREAVNIACMCDATNEKRKDIAVNQLIETAKDIGVELTTNVASEIIERGVQRYLK